MKLRSRVLNYVLPLLALVVGIVGGGALTYAADPTPARAAAGTKPQAQATASEQALIKLEKDWWEAFKNRDKTALEGILADEFFGIDNDAAKPTNKREWIDRTVNGESRVESYSIEHFEVRVVADTAVVAVRYSLRRTVKGVEHSEHCVDMDTFVRRNGRWQALGTAEVSVAAGK
jgi:hypothetical protein